MSSFTTNEASPLLPQTIEEEEKKEDGDVLHKGILESLSFVSRPLDNDVISVPELPPFSILMEVIGCRNLLFAPNDESSISGHFETYCVIQYGLETVHRTLPYRGHISLSNPSRAARIGQAVKQGLLKVGGGGDTTDPVAQSLQNPIWTVHHDSLWSIPNVTHKDIANHKTVVIHVWARPIQTSRSTLRASSKQPTLVGKVRLHIEDLVSMCTEERVELPLVDELGRDVIHSAASKEKSTVAFRCRIATPADLEFVDHWNHPATTDTPVHKRIVDEVWQRAEVLEGDNLQKRAVLLTELPEDQVQGASLSTAMKGAMGRPDGKVWVKPYPDPDVSPSSPSKGRFSPSKQQPSPGNHMYMTPEQLKQEMILPSRQWIQAGNSKQAVGRLYLEILSAHDLPNVDLGGTMGNKTDAFCSVVYGDTMVQTDLIDDELSPHWLPWTKRAFVFNISKEWRNPSGVGLYIGVFGFKRKPMRRHKPIGRVEIHPFNLQRNTLYELEYNLYKDSHSTTRTAQGRIRIRLRLEIDNERAALLAPLYSMLPSPKKPAIYINVQTKKSLACARFTACGEYDNGGKFQLGVLQGYIDEIVQGYIRRIVYAVSDGGRSLMFWQPHNQLQIPIAGGVVIFPLYSLLCFVMGVMVVEHPQFLPGMLCLAISMFMLARMNHRNRSPNPWKRCNSFEHYMRILLGCPSSTPNFEKIQPNEGWEETKAEEEKLKHRIERDREFLQKKEAVEKELEKVEKFKIESKSKDLIHIELLGVLGKVQGIVGDVCRLCRFVDSILTWEEGDLAFFITLAFLVVEAIFLLLPWAFLLRWTGRILVVVFLGPQNRLLDVWYIQKQNDDERKLRLLFQERIFQARYKTEETAKLRAFRQTVFGKYSFAVPSILWTPHNDSPLPSSTASYEGTRMEHLSDTGKRLSGATGQLLFGAMIPRHHAAMEQNKQHSIEQKESIEAVFALMRSNPGISPTTTSSVVPCKRQREPSILLDEGFEVTDLFDEEAQYIKDVLKAPPPDESIRELGVEIMPDAATMSNRFIPAWKSVHEFPSDTVECHDDCSSSSSSSDEDADMDLSSTAPKEDPVRRSLNETHRIERMAHQSTTELGVEISEEFENEAAFARQSWQGSISISNNDQMGQMARQSTTELGVEISEEFENEAAFARQSWQGSISNSNNDQIMERMARQSTIELGVEIAEEFLNEAAFASRSWQGSSSSSLAKDRTQQTAPHSLQEDPMNQGYQR